MNQQIAKALSRYYKSSRRIFKKTLDTFKLRSFKPISLVSHKGNVLQTFWNVFFCFLSIHRTVSGIYLRLKPSFSHWLNFFNARCNVKLHFARLVIRDKGLVINRWTHVSIPGMNFCSTFALWKQAFLRNFRDQERFSILIITVGIYRVCFDLYAVQR